MILSSIYHMSLHVCVYASYYVDMLLYTDKYLTEQMVYKYETHIYGKQTLQTDIRHFQNYKYCYW